MNSSDNFKDRKGIRDEELPDAARTQKSKSILPDSNIPSYYDSTELLLSLSLAITTVSDKTELLDLVSNKLPAFFNGDGVLIAIVDKECPGNYFVLGTQEMHLPVNGKTGEIEDFGFGGSMKSSLLRNLSAQAFQRAEPLCFDVFQPDDDDFIEILKFTGQSQAGKIVISGLGSEGRELGAIIIMTNNENLVTEQSMRMVKFVSSQLAVVVKNILINEAILRQQSENNALLAFGNDIAIIRDKHGLALAIQKIILNLSGTDEFILTLIDEDRNCRNIFLYKLLSPLVSSERFHRITESPLTFSDRIADTVFHAERPVKFDLDREVEAGRLDTAYAVLFKAMNIGSMVGTALRVGENKVGILWLHAEKLSERQIIGIASQTATAIANIRANEKIERQLKEITGFHHKLEVEKLYLKEEIETTHHSSDLIGSGEGMNKILHMISKVAETSSSVLILGETGTGKELIARAIHNASPRRDKMMVKINCAALPPNLIESELFGHERGSFTGATDRRIGKFELANNSTLFLDEIGELPIDLQVKLLRVLQEKEIERVGGKTVIKLNVRIIAATNRDLKHEVKVGNFRSDLYFRLNVFPVFLPPLRERKEDINILAVHFLNKISKKVGKKVLGFSSKVIKQLNAYDWPGNVRELEHLIERSILLNTQPMISKIYLPDAENTKSNTHLIANRVKTIDEVEREHILYVLRKCKGKVFGIGGAAELLNIPSTTLGSKIKRLGITKEYSSE